MSGLRLRGIVRRSDMPMQVATADRALIAANRIVV